MFFIPLVFQLGHDNYYEPHIFTTNIIFTFIYLTQDLREGIRSTISAVSQTFLIQPFVQNILKEADVNFFFTVHNIFVFAKLSPSPS